MQTRVISYEEFERIYGASRRGRRSKYEDVLKSIRPGTAVLVATGTTIGSAKIAMSKIAKQLGMPPPLFAVKRAEREGDEDALYAAYPPLPQPPKPVVETGQAPAAHPLDRSRVVAGAAAAGRPRMATEMAQAR